MALLLISYVWDMQIATFIEKAEIFLYFVVFLFDTYHIWQYTYFVIIICVYPEKDMLFRFVISQRDILPPGQYLLAFYFAEISVRSLRMSIRHHSLFLCLKAGEED